MGAFLPQLFGEFNRGTLLLLGDFGRWQIGALVAAALLVCVLTAIDLRDLGARRRWLLVSLRVLVLAIAVLLVLEPALELKHVSLVRNHVTVLVDVSETQGLRADGGQTRWQRTVEAVRALESTLDPADPEHVFEWVAFGAQSEASSAAALSEAEPTAPATALLEAMRASVERHGARDIGGFVVVSDGIDNGELAGRTARGEDLDAETLRLLDEWGVPVHTVATARAGEIRDIAVSRVVHDDFAFVRNAVSVVAELRVLGVEGQPLTVTLRRNGAPLQTRQVVVESGKTTYSVQFEFVPELIGKEIYSVDTPVLAGEAIEENNVEHFVLDVIRDKIRVLQVVGRPSWDVRFMRQLLQNNPNVDLICFFILRTQDDIHRGSERELSLIPFPTRELFNEQLGSFDLVIFQNFDYAPYDMRQYLPRVRDYVRGGGGFVMIGGDLSFQSGGYAQTEVAEVLPVELPGGTDRASLVDLGNFRPALTEAGQRHPITRLAFDAADNRALWESLPPMRGTNVVLAPRPGSVVLATHPRLRAGDAAMPVVTVAETGEGRSMAVTYDSSWRWAFESVSRGGASQPYTAFWNSAIRWLIRDPALNLVDVELPEDVAEPGETVAGAVRVFEPDYSPSIGRPLTLTVERRDLDALGGDAGEQVLQEVVSTNDRGIARFELRDAEPGAYVVRASVEDGNGQVLEDEEVFLRVRRSRELRDVDPRPELLSQLAEASDGRFLESGARPRGLEFRGARVEEVDRRRVVDLWNTPWVLAVLVALLTLEWSLRRRWGRL